MQYHKETSSFSLDIFSKLTNYGEIWCLFVDLVKNMIQVNIQQTTANPWKFCNIFSLLLHFFRIFLSSPSERKIDEARSEVSLQFSCHHFADPKTSPVQLRTQFLPQMLNQRRTLLLLETSAKNSIFFCCLANWTRDACCHIFYCVSKTQRTLFMQSQRVQESAKSTLVSLVTCTQKYS